MADGLIVRSGMGIVVQDLDGDGSEQTGWNHLASRSAQDGFGLLPLATACKASCS